MRATTRQDGGSLRIPGILRTIRYRKNIFLLRQAELIKDNHQSMGHFNHEIILLSPDIQLAKEGYLVLQSARGLSPAW